jgi:hypothetical protein
MTQDKAAKVNTKEINSRRKLNNADSCLQTKKKDRTQQPAQEEQGIPALSTRLEPWESLF